MLISFSHGYSATLAAKLIIKLEFEFESLRHNSLLTMDASMPLMHRLYATIKPVLFQQQRFYRQSIMSINGLNEHELQLARRKQR